MAFLTNREPELRVTETREIPVYSPDKSGNLFQQVNVYGCCHGELAPTPINRQLPKQEQKAVHWNKSAAIPIALAGTAFLATATAGKLTADYLTSSNRLKQGHVATLTEAKQSLELAENAAIADGFVPSELVESLGVCR